MTQRQLHHEKAHLSMGDRSSKLGSWSTLNSLYIGSSACRRVSFPSDCALNLSRQLGWFLCLPGIWSGVRIFFAAFSTTEPHPPAPHWGILGRALPLSHVPPALHWGILGRGSTTEPRPQPDRKSTRLNSSPDV